MPKRFKIKSYNKLNNQSKLTVNNMYFSINDSESYYKDDLTLYVDNLFELKNYTSNFIISYSRENSLI